VNSHPEAYDGMTLGRVFTFTVDKNSSHGNAAVVAECGLGLV